MRKALTAITVLLLAFVGAHAQDAREAVAKALQNQAAARTVSADQIEVSVVPECEEFSRDWRIKRARFDASLRSWVVEMTCAGSRVPFLAIAHVDDPRWLAVKPEHKSATPVVVRAGEVRSITLQMNGVRISEPVVCLRSGRTGEVIRVQSLDRKVTRRALISDTGKLVLAGQ